MAKGKQKGKAVEVASPPAVPPPVTDARLVDQEPVYAFPNKARCPRCGSVDTTRVGDHGDTQYRECQKAVCRKRFPVKGTSI